MQRAPSLLTLQSCWLINDLKHVNMLKQANAWVKVCRHKQVRNIKRYQHFARPLAYVRHCVREFGMFFTHHRAQSAQPWISQGGLCRAQAVTFETKRHQANSITSKLHTENKPDDPFKTHTIVGHQSGRDVKACVLDVFLSQLRGAKASTNSPLLFIALCDARG